jgi:hypothetical protein
MLHVRLTYGHRSAGRFAGRFLAQSVRPSLDGVKDTRLSGRAGRRAAFGFGRAEGVGYPTYRLRASAARGQVSGASQLSEQRDSSAISAAAHRIKSSCSNAR